ncbi:nuclear transport factor 2 family protein [Caenimonas sedimenti]|uniref:Nuclear transport factor 2 family protein n=1 Tax=Caenimonas sedimenti TaxID=2596921 RepID=A0A562ZLP7_9BURK|nr:nuclear transport factor 2 family protein [Caenimonas sedimenti]
MTPKSRSSEPSTPTSRRCWPRTPRRSCTSTTPRSGSSTPGASGRTNARLPGESPWKAGSPRFATRPRVTFEGVKIISEADFACMSAFVTYTGISAQGQELRAMQNRISWALRNRGHVLRIVHEHTSAPIGFEDHKAILEREGKS